MVNELSPAEISTLWLLHDRHTTRHAVEKAIELGLPLWREAVHLARACHRSNMDLADGAYYVVGSDFVDNDDSSQYAYHEIGRYPDVRASSSFRNIHCIQKGDLDSDIDVTELYNSATSEILPQSSASESLRNDAMESFKNDKNKHIQLLLEGISSRELDNLNSEQSSLEVCEISDDDESLCTRSCVVASASPPNEDVNDAVSNETNCANDSKSIRRATPQASTCSNETLDFDCGLHLHDRELSRHCEVPSTSCTRAFTILDRSEYERRLLSENEQITEEERQMSIYETSPYGDSEVEDSHRAAMEINDAVSQLAPDIEMSEVISKLMKEDVAAEFSDAGTPSKRSKRCYVEPFDEDSNTTGSECSDINIDVNILYEISELRREEGASSPSSCSIDSDDAVPPDVCVWHPQTWTYNIDLITHFRSPSPFEEAVVTLLPREYVELTVIAPKYEEMFAAVELIRRFPHSGAFTRKRGGRCVSVSFNIPAPRNQNVFLECDLWRTTQANEFYHYVVPESCMDYVSLKSESSKEEFCLLESHIKNAKQENEDCLIEMEDRRVSADYLSTNASTHECCDVHCDIYNAAGISDCSYIQCEDSHFQNVSLNAKEAEENVVDVFQAIARTQDHTERCSAMFSDTRRTYASLSCSAPRCEDVVTYWVFDILLGNSAITTLNDKRIYKVAHSCKPRSLRAERGPLRMNVEAPTRRRRQGDSMNEVLLLLETGAMPSQFIETSPPHSLPLNKGRTRSRYQNLRGAIGPGNRGKGEAVASQLQETLLITPRKRPCLEVSPTTRPERSPALRSPSERSDLSASPDRLVICEDEDAIAEEDRIKVTEDLQNTPSNALAISTKSSTASLEEESFDNYTTPSEKPSLNVTDFPLLRRSARKRSADHSESPVVAKKSREPVEHALISKQGGKSEESIEVGSDTDRSKSLRKARYLSKQTHSSVPDPNVLSPLSKSVRKSELLASYPEVVERKRMLRSGEMQQVFTRTNAQVFRDPAKQLNRKETVAKLVPEPSVGVQDEKELRATQQLLAHTTVCAEQISPDIPTLNPNTKSRRKQRTPVIELCKELYAESAAAFVAIPLKATVGVQFSVISEESVSFQCVAPPRESGLDILAQVAIFEVSNSIRQTTSQNLETARASVESRLVTLRRKRTTNTCSDETTSFKPQGTFCDVSDSFGAEVHADEDNSVDNVASFVEERQNLMTASITATKLQNEKSNQPRLHSVQLPKETPKRMKMTAAERTDAKKCSSTPKDTASFETVLEPLSRSYDTRALSKRRSTTAKQKIRNNVVVLEDNNETVFPKKVQDQTEILRRSSSRRRTQVAEEPCCSNDRLRSMKEKVASQRVQAIPQASSKTTNRRKTIAAATPRKSNVVGSNSTSVEAQMISKKGKPDRLSMVQPMMKAALVQSTEQRRRTTALCSSAQNTYTDDDDVLFVESGFSRRRRKSVTPPILVVAVDVTSSFTPIKRDNNRSAEPITLPTCNRGESVATEVYSSDSAEVLNALALDIIIREASALSAVNLATFAHFVLNLFDPVKPVFTPLEDVEPSTLPANFTTIFERATPLQFRHRLDYNSFNSMLLNRLPENGLHALTLDLPKVSMLKITKFVDTVKEAVEEICAELSTRKTLSKAEIKREIDLSGEVQQLITSRYVETMMKMADACNEARDVPPSVIADRFHLLLCGWTCFLQQGGVLRVRLQLCPGRSHPSIVDITTAWLDRIDTILSRAQATKSMRTSAFAVSLAQEKTVVSKVWYQMASHTTTCCADASYLFCEECKLYFRNEDTDFIHNRVFHQKSRECDECYDMFHTLLGLDLHMVGSHKRSFVVDL